MKDLEREGWKEVSLGDVCDIYQPKTISAKQMVPDGPYPVFGANGVIGRYKEYNHEEAQLLVTCRGATCGSVNMSDPFSWITGNAMVVRPKVADLSLRYVEYFFRGAVDLDGVITGAAQPQITRKSLAPVRIGYPSLEKQQRIVTVLDDTFEGLARARAHAEANLQNARVLFESARQIALSPPDNPEGWLVTKLGDAATLQRGFDLPKAQRTVGQFPLVTSSGATDTHNVAKVKGPGVATGRSGSIGNVFFIEDDFWPLNTALYVKDFHGNFPKYIFYLLKQFDLSRFASGAGIPTLNRNGVHDELVTVPISYEKQKEIASRIDGVFEATKGIEQTYTAKLQDIDDLRQSLLQKAFAGELT